MVDSRLQAEATDQVNASGKRVCTLSTGTLAIMPVPPVFEGFLWRSSRHSSGSFRLRLRTGHGARLCPGETAEA
jgi:hypothetical protein